MHASHAQNKKNNFFSEITKPDPNLTKPLYLNKIPYVLAIFCNAFLLKGAISTHNSCGRRVYERSSTSISLGDSHRASSNRKVREERALLFSPSVSSTGNGEGRTGSQSRQSRATSYGIDNINRKRKADYT